MIKEYEKALMENYVLQLVPQVAELKFAAGDEAFYRDEKILKYPAVRVYREDSQPSFCEHYTLQTNEGESITCWPYDQPYTIRVYVEKQTEAISVRDYMRIAHFKNPYVHFELDDTPIKIGVRLLQIQITSDRDNYDEKGAKRVVEFTMTSRLVLRADETIPVIKKVIIRMNKGVKKLEVTYDELTWKEKLKYWVSSLF